MTYLLVKTDSKQGSRKVVWEIIWKNGSKVYAPKYAGLMRFSKAEVLYNFLHIYLQFNQIIKKEFWSNCEIKDLTSFDIVAEIILPIKENH